MADRYIYIYISQAARQGLAVLMASAVVVQKHETSTLCLSHNLIIDLKFGVIDHVREFTNRKFQPCQIWFGSDEWSRRYVGATYTGPVTFIFFLFFFILQHSYSPNP